MNHFGRESASHWNRCLALLPIHKTCTDEVSHSPHPGFHVADGQTWCCRRARTATQRGQHPKWPWQCSQAPEQLKYVHKANSGLEVHVSPPPVRWHWCPLPCSHSQCCCPATPSGYSITWWQCFTLCGLYLLPGNVAEALEGLSPWSLNHAHQSCQLLQRTAVKCTVLSCTLEIWALTNVTAAGERLCPPWGSVSHPQQSSHWWWGDCFLGLPFSPVRLLESGSSQIPLTGAWVQGTFFWKVIES